MHIHLLSKKGGFMQITICKTAGLCAGASKAYNLVIDELEKNKKAVVYKEILHNEVLINDLIGKGATFINGLTQVEKGDKLILRAHGEEKGVYEELGKNNIKYIDAMCVNVKRVHDIAIEKQSLGYKIIVVGKIKNGRYHDEIYSLISFLNNPILITCIEDINKVNLEQYNKYFIVSQTTYPLEKFTEIVNKLVEKGSAIGVQVEYKNTICNFPLVNIKESIKLAKENDVAIIVGSKNSSNTMELYNAVKDIVYTIYSNDFDEIVEELKLYVKSQKIDINTLKVCILAGASTLKNNLSKLKNMLIIHF